MLEINAQRRESKPPQGLRRAIRICDHAETNYLKKCFRMQKSSKAAGFGSEIARIRFRLIRSSKVPILSIKCFAIAESSLLEDERLARNRCALAVWLAATTAFTTQTREKQIVKFFV